MGALVLLSANGALPGVPLPEPLTLEDEIKYHGRWIFTGRLRRAVFLSPTTSKKLFTQGAQIDPIELRLYERHELQTVSEGFLEIDDASPVLMRSDISPKEVAEVATGTVYCYLGNLGREMDAYIASLIGKIAIFFFRTQIPKFGISATSFPNSLYELSGGSNWRDGLPLPIAALPRVIAIAETLGFVKPHQR